MATQKRNERVIALSCTESQRFVAFVQVLITIDRRVTKERAQQKKKNGCTHQCSTKTEKTKIVRLKISGPHNCGLSPFYA